MCFILLDNAFSYDGSADIFNQNGGERKEKIKVIKKGKIEAGNRQLFC